MRFGAHAARREIGRTSYPDAPAASSTQSEHLPSRHAPTLLASGSRIAQTELASMNRSDQFRLRRVSPGTRLGLLPDGYRLFRRRHPRNATPKPTSKMLEGSGTATVGAT